MGDGMRSVLWGGDGRSRCLLENLLEQAASSPFRIAIEDGDLRISYEELVRWSRCIAGELLDSGVGVDDVVGVSIPRGADAVAAFLATVMIGSTYLPLDTSYPVRRLEHMLNDSGAKVLLQAGGGPDLETTAVRVRIPDPAQREALDGRSRMDDSRAGLVSHCRSDQPVYIIYTSGSTGWPKGVALPHRCVDNMVNWQVSHSPRADLRTAQFAPLNFDVFVQETLGTLCGGGTLVIVPESVRRDSFVLLDWLAETGVERLFLPYVALNMLAAVARHRAIPRLSLVEINTAGEQMVSTPAIRSFFAEVPDCRLVIHYGQSESAMVTSHILDRASSSWPALPPIGGPLPGCELLIDPTDGDPDVGELLVAGLPLAAGYLGLPELNATRYLTVAPTAHGNRTVFRTGDLVRFDGEAIHFLGRIGDEVKIRGVRVNPLETEAWLLEQKGVSQAVCVVAEHGPLRRFLRAAVTVDREMTHVDLEAIRHGLSDVLPEVAVPRTIEIVDSLPRTPSGKIDRAEVAKRLGVTAAANSDHT